MDRLSVYIAAANLAHRETEVRASIAQGAQDVRTIMTQPWSASELCRYAARDIPPAVRARQATGIMWYLTALAVKRNQGFRDGAFVCRDPQGRLSAYFRGIGTPRTSSHLRRHSAPGCTGGVDLCTDENDVVPPLPHGHRHVLYIAIAEDKRRGSCLFLKPEHYGVAGFWDWAYHAVRYIRSLVRRYLCCGGYDSIGMRKERIPDRYVRAFSKAVTCLPDGPSAIAEVGYHGGGEGIGYMHEYLTAKLADVKLSESVRVPILTLLLQLRSEYDFVGLRFGNEVFLDLAIDLSGPLPEAPEVHGPSPSLRWLGSCSGDESVSL
ncbi:hypothetical protein NKR23_g1175 [Pleurostoma richardsiae]|uniref:Uncharacterized protein n=1 Tax=Pleurostoma richardsiae TaxID=41990 RepID=A0AA38S549_9PEZI|nr:hypothetical protein NKR23_g1175 [Pleurostoma richardsiae]